MLVHFYFYYLAAMAFATANSTNILDANINRIIDGMDALFQLDLMIFSVFFIRSHLAKDDYDMKKIDYIAPLVVIITTIQLFVSLSARAESELIEKLDLDKDGQITIKEAVADPAVLASFGKIDTDGNGKISSLELVKTKIVLTEEKNMSKSLL